MVCLDMFLQSGGLAYLVRANPANILGMLQCHLSNLYELKVSGIIPWEGSPEIYPQVIVAMAKGVERKDRHQFGIHFHPSPVRSGYSIHHVTGLLGFDSQLGTHFLVLSDKCCR